MITNTTNVSLNAYFYLSTVKQNSDILPILKFKDRRKFESYSNICIVREHHILRPTYENEWYITARNIKKILSEPTTYMDQSDHFSKKAWNAAETHLRGFQGLHWQ